MTMSAVPWSRGSSSFGMSDPAYWLSASVLTMKSAPSFTAASMPAMNAAARPLCRRETDDVVDALTARHGRGIVARPVVDDQATR